ncbi:MAG: hypothetical protein VYC17_01130 [Nitrospinota bacterium]|nr:hypothetical protein [Nitrospinota bacterium]
MTHPSPKDLSRVAAWFIIFLANLVFFLPYLFVGDPQTLGAESGDLPSFFKPMREFAAAQLAQGSFPLWNPYSSGGHPFIADPENSRLSPFTYLFTLLPSHLAFSWSYFSHYLICAYGMFFLCKRFRISHAGSLTAVFIYLFSAPHVLHLYAGHFTMINTLAWTPWLFWSLESFLATFSWRHAAGFGLFLGLHLLGGFPQYTYMIGWASLAYGLYAGVSRNLFPSIGRIFIRLGGGMILGAGLFLTQATLAKELVDHSTRHKNDLSFSSSFSLSKENLITLLIPKYFGETAVGGNEANAYFGKTFVWENSCYMGGISLMLFLAALGEWRNSFIRFWFFLFLASLLIATGPLTPLFRICYEYLPGFSLFRGYSKALTVACLALAILAGKGLDATATRPGGFWDKTVFVTVPGILVGFSVALLAVPEALPFWKDQLLRQLDAWNLPPDAARIHVHFSVLQSHLFEVTAMILLAAGVFWIHQKFSFLSLYFPFIIGLLVLAEFFIYAKPYFRPLDFNKFTVPDPLILPIREKSHWTRTFHAHPIAANLSLANQVPAVGGFENFTLKPYALLANFFNGTRLDKKNLYLAIRPSPQIMKFYAANYFISDGEPPFPMKKIALATIGGGAPWILYENENRSPRYHIAQTLKPFPIGADMRYENPQQFAHLVQAMLNEFPETAFVSPETYRRVSTTQPSSANLSVTAPRIKVIAEEINRILLQLELSAPGILTVSENFYPGWRGRIDGIDTEVFPVNLVMKGAQVPSGNHQVEFYFVPTHYYANMLVYLFSLLTLSGLILINPGEGRPSSNPD